MKEKDKERLLMVALNIFIETEKTRIDYIKMREGSPDFDVNKYDSSRVAYSILMAKMLLDDCDLLGE